jgi:hypothetical protein
LFGETPLPWARELFGTLRTTADWRRLVNQSSKKPSAQVLPTRNGTKPSASMVDRRIANSGQVRGLSSSLESTGWKALSKRKLCLVIFILLPLLNIVQTRIYSREQAHHVPAAKSPRHHDLLSLREILHLLEKHEKEIHEKHRASRDTVTVVLNVFLRPGAFRRVLDGIGSQTVLQSITHVNVLALGSPFVHQYGKLLEEYRKTASWTSEVSISLVTSEPTFNPGYFGRFLLSMNLNTTFTLILDDDVVLGARYLELCLRWARSITTCCR